MKLRKLFQRSRAPSIKRDKLPEPELLIISYPKSGRTWARLMLGRYLCDNHKINPKLALETRYLTYTAGVLASDFTHDNLVARPGKWTLEPDNKSQYRSKKVMLLIRDPRDVIVSCYFQATKRDRAYRGPISEFLRDPLIGLRCYLDFLEQWDTARHVPANLFIIRYEDMHFDPEGSLRKILEFIGCSSLDDVSLAETIQYTKFSNMQALEANRYFASKRLSPGDVNDPESYKVRKGKVGGYRDYLSADDIAYIDRQITDSRCIFLDSYRSRIAVAS